MHMQTSVIYMTLRYINITDEITFSNDLFAKVKRSKLPQRFVLLSLLHHTNFPTGLGPYVSLCAVID